MVKTFLIQLLIYESIYDLLNSPKCMSVMPGFDLDFCAFCCSFWFFLARFGFSSFLLFVDLRCFLLPVLALSGFSLLLISTTFNRSRQQMKENGNKKCSLLLSVALCCSFWFVVSVSICC